MKLYFWVAACVDDNECYSAIGRSQKECREDMEERGGKFDEPVRKLIEYSDAFDLFRQVTQEGGGRASSGRETKKGPR